MRGGCLTRRRARSFSLHIAAAEFITWDTRARRNDGPPLDPLSTYSRTTRSYL